MSRLNDIEKLRGWCHKILPLVYDDSLSYYEVLCKVRAKINEVIDLTAEQNDIIEEMVQEVADWETTTDNKYEEFTQRMTTLFNQLVTDITTQENQFETSMNTRFDAFTSNTNSIVNKYKNDFVPDFNENHIYIVGEYCYYGDDNKFLYRCTGVPSGVLLPPQPYNVYTWEQVDGAYPYGGVANNIVRDLDAWMSNKNGEITGRFNQLAQTYSNARTYEVGEVAWAYTSLDPMLQPSWHLYICTTAVETAEAFDPTKWENIVLAQYLEDQYAQFLEDYQRQFGVVQDRGSSTTDVMSQKAVSDVLEAHDDSISKLLSDLAPEYDDEELYKIGNLLTYLGKQYYCIADAPAGTLPTNTTYFEEKSVADIIEMIKQGAIVTGHAGVADNLTPYSEDSGVIQDTPFISQETGTDNNSVIVTTGDTAKQLEKLGNAVVYTQLCKSKTNPTLSVAGVTFTNNNDGTWTANGTATALDGVVLNDAFNTIQGHRYLFGVICSDANIQGYEYISNTLYSRKNGLSVLTGTGNNFQPRVTVENGATYTNAELRFVSIDLDKWTFTADQIADITANPSHFSWYYNGSLAYNTGSIKHGDGVKLVCTRGRNLWDEQWEQGYYNGDGVPMAGNAIRSKNDNPIKVVPNTICYFYCDGLPASSTEYIYILFFDKELNVVEKHSIYGSSSVKTFNIPSNCEYIKFFVSSGYGTTYKNDITISKYYTPEQGGEGYDQYYPYEEPDIIDTGSEQLGAFDKKTPDGVITRASGNVTNFTNWNSDAQSSEGYIRFVSPSSAATKAFGVTNVKSNLFVTASSIIPTYATFEGISGYQNGPSIYLSILASRLTGDLSTMEGRATAFANWATANNLEIEYELDDAHKTTEQGTSFRQYAGINDYGIMYWLDSNDELVSIPQGCKIQYPVNYKGFVDDLYMYTDGDATALAKNEDITDTALNERGYYKMQDLSSHFTLGSLWDENTSKFTAIQAGKTVTISFYLIAKASGGGTETLFRLASDVSPTTTGTQYFGGILYAPLGGAVQQAYARVYNTGSEWRIQETQLVYQATDVLFGTITYILN